MFLEGASSIVSWWKTSAVDGSDIRRAPVDMENLPYLPLCTGFISTISGGELSPDGPEASTVSEDGLWD